MPGTRQESPSRSVKPLRQVCGFTDALWFPSCGGDPRACLQRRETDGRGVLTVRCTNSAKCLRNLHEADTPTRPTPKSNRALNPGTPSRAPFLPPKRPHSDLSQRGSVLPDLLPIKFKNYTNRAIRRFSCGVWLLSLDGLFLRSSDGISCRQSSLKTCLFLSDTLLEFLNIWKLEGLYSEHPYIVYYSTINIPMFAFITYVSIYPSGHQSLFF